MLIPVVSVLAALTLLPALLAVLGRRVNAVRVMPRRLLDHGHGEDGVWGRWARFVLRRPVAVAAVGIVATVVLAGLGTQLNTHETELARFPGGGTAIAGRQVLADAGISPGVMKPLNVLVENGADPEQAAQALRGVDGVVGRLGADRLAGRRDVPRRGVPRHRRRRPRHHRHHRPRRHRARGHRRHAHRHHRRRPGLPGRAVPGLPVDPRARPAARRSCC